MKNLITTAVSLFAFIWSFAAVNVDNNKVPLNEAYVPEMVKESFNNAYFVSNENVKWYPYPYINSNDESSVFSSINYLNMPEYFEAEFTKENSKLRKVYSADGDALLKIEILNRNKLPVHISDTLKDLGFDLWGLRTFEYITDLESKESFYKLIMTNWSKTRALYFDENYELDKLRKWDDYLYGQKRSKLSLKSAYNGVRKPVSAIELPANIFKNMSNSINIGSQALGYWEVEPVHVPQSRSGLEYYDITLESLYEVVYKKGRKTLKNSYNSEGVFLETVEVISWDKLPKYVIEATEKKQYAYWIFEENIEKVKLEDGTIIYRLHAVEYGEHQVLVVKKN